MISRKKTISFAEHDVRRSAIKRVVALFMVLAMCFSLCACDKSSVSEAVADARVQLSEWSSQTYNNYKYSGVYDEKDNSFCITLRYQGSVISDMLAIDKMISQTASETAFKKTNKMFSKFDTDVCVLMIYPDSDIITYTANDYT